MTKIRLSLPVLLVIAAVALGGCSGDDSSGSSSSSGSTLTNLAPPGSLVYVEGDLKPTGTMKENVDWAAGKLAGVENLGDFVVSELESSARENGESLDFAREVEPWLGERAGIAFERIENGELSEPLIAIETTDPKATEAFVDKRTEQSGERSKDVSYNGVAFKVGGSEDNAIGIVEDALVIADGEGDFKAVVDAAAGDSLADEGRFQDAIEAASESSFVDVYVDIGGIIEQSDDRIDPQAQEILEGAGIDPSDATAVASIVPQSNHIEIDFASNLSGEKPPAGESTKLLGSLPVSAFAAFSFSGFGDQLGEAIDELDESGLPPDLPPGELKSTLSQAGIDLDEIADSLEEGAVFAEGHNRNTLSGALVVTSSSNEAAKTIASLGTLLRGARVPGVTAVKGKASGFSIRSPDLGDKPVVVVAKDDRVVIAYGLSAAFAGIETEPLSTLGRDFGYQAAVELLGDVPISAYINGPQATHVAEVLVPRSETDFWNIAPYLKFTYIGIGTGTDGDLATAKLVAGLGE